MEFDSQTVACAATVQRGDDGRFRAVMAAPVAVRPVLFAIHALNIEVARVPWLTQEPAIAEMRLQWWRDALDELKAGGPVRRHDVTLCLAGGLDAHGAALLDGLIAARRWDIYREPFEDEPAFMRYIDDTQGNLLCAAAWALGPGDEAVLRDFAFATGMARWLLAIPELEARGRYPLPDGRPAAVGALAVHALARLRRARAARGAVSRRAGYALLAGAGCGAILRQAARDPGLVAAGALGQSDAGGRLRLMFRAVSGRW